jgi:hypothetical protein
MQTAPRSALDGIVIALATAIGFAVAVATDLGGPTALAVATALPALAFLTVAGPRVLWGQRRQHGE